MSAVHFYSIAYNRPDFISLQYNSLKKQWHRSDSGGYDFNFTVMINTKDERMQRELVDVCETLSLPYVLVPIKQNELYNGGLTAYNYVRDNYFHKTSGDDFSILMDSDMFFYAPLNIPVLMNGYDVSAIYHQRQKRIFGISRYNYEYLWVGFMIFSHKRFDWQDIRFDPISNICDVGGMTHYFVKENLKKGLKVKWLEHTADISHDYKHILPESLWGLYEPAMGCQIIEDSIIHYYRGSNWDGNKVDFLKRKDKFLYEFLKSFDGKPLYIKGTLYHNSLAYARKTYNGTNNNINEKVVPTYGAYS